MNIDSVRGLKAELLGGVAAEALPTPVAPIAMALMAHVARRAQPLAKADPLPRTLALGVSRRTKNDFRLAIRIQRRSLESSPQVEALRRRAKGEVDVRYIGQLTKRVVPAYQRRQRPLYAGLSIGHYRITAGTLGTFVTLAKGGDARMLSNNHVFADENRGKPGDDVIQSGAYDNGRLPQDRVGALAEFVRLSKTRVNRVDCALATIDAATRYRAGVLKGHGQLAGVAADPVDIADQVEKLGRTTGHTRGRVTAFELDNVVVGYDLGNLRFDDQIEVEGAGSGPFSDGGDSGSLVYTTKGHFAVGLLFAGGDVGGSNGAGLTYLNPIGTVFARLKVELLLP